LNKSRYKKGDIVLVRSRAGDVIPNVHVKLVERIIVKPTQGKMVGFKKSMDWPGYSGWEAEMVNQDEIDNLRKNWSIPFYSPGDRTFVFDDCIIKKPRKQIKNTSRKTSSSGSTTIRRKRKKS